MKLVIKKPADCTAEELRAFAQMVIDGGQASCVGLERNIRRAKLLAFAFVDGELAGVGGIKRTPWLYVREVFLKANEVNEAINFRYEIGWSYTRPEFRNRGIHDHIVYRLLEATSDRNIFLITGTDNEAVKKVFSRRGFEKCGSPYPDRFDAKQLWVRKVAGEKNPSVLFLKSVDLLLRGVERSESCKNLLVSFRRKVKTRLTGAH